MKSGLLRILAVVAVLFSTTAFAQNRQVVSQTTLKKLHHTLENRSTNVNMAGLPLESFDTFLPEGWKKITNFGGVGWQQGEVDSQVVGFDSGVFDAPPGGGRFVAYASWATGDEDGDFSTGQQTDQWLITPRLFDVQPGDSLRFYLRYFSRFNDNLEVWISTRGDSIADFDTLVTVISFTGPGNNEWRPYSFALTDFVSVGDSIFIGFRERVANTRVEGDALFLDLVEVGKLVTDVRNRATVPEGFALHQNYPNPFNPSTTIAFTLTQRAQVTLSIYNLLGQRVAILAEEQEYPPGEHRVVFDATRLPNGIYYYRLEAGGFVDVKKMTMVR